jgi:hypothetical protein
MTVLAATGVTGIPGIATTLAALLSVLMWMPWPGAAIVAVPCVLLAVLTCVIATRLAATLSTGLGGNRRGRELVGTIVLAVVIFAGPILSGAVALLSGVATSSRSCSGLPASSRGPRSGPPGRCPATLPRERGSSPPCASRSPSRRSVCSGSRGVPRSIGRRPRRPDVLPAPSARCARPLRRHADRRGRGDVGASLPGGCATRGTCGS